MSETPSEVLGGVQLATALESLREELEGAYEQGRNRRIRFRVTDVTLTVQVVARREKEGTGKLRWWLIEAGGQVSSGSETMQTLVLTLQPGVHDGNAEPGPLDVHGEESAPAG
jgi:hypothetical protein